MQTLERVVSHDIAARMIAANRADQEGAKAAGAYQAAAARTLELFEQIGEAVAQHAERAMAANATYPGQAWHFVGELNEASKLLTEALARVGGRL